MQTQQRDAPLFSRESDPVIGNMSGSLDELRAGSAHQPDTVRVVTPFSTAERR